MSEIPGKHQDPQPQTGLDDIAAILAEQIAAGHAAAARCFAMGADEEDFGEKARNESLKIATRLIGACASAAEAIKRIKGTEFHYRVTVDRPDAAAEKAVRAARKKKLTGRHDEKIRAEIDRKFGKIFGVDFAAMDAEREAKAAKEASLKTANSQTDQDVEQ